MHPASTGPVEAGDQPQRVVAARDGVDVLVHLLDGGGDGGGRWLVLAHATGFHGLVWRPVSAELRPAFRSAAPDLRGHGDSGPAPGGDFDWRGFAADVLAVVDGLGLHRPGGIGHSSGATALLLAEQARPGTFAGLYCYEPVVVPADPPLGPDPANWMAEACRRRRDRFASPAEALEHYADKRPLSELDPEVLRLYVAHGLEPDGHGGQRLKCRPDDEAAVYEMATAHDAFGRLPSVTCPVTLAYGARSEAFSRSHAEQLAGRMPDTAVVELADLGHFGPLQSPWTVAGSARDALAGLG